MARGPFFTYRPGGMGERFFGGADPLATLQREMNRVLDELEVPLRSAQTAGGVSHLSVDVSETPEAFKVCADVPGVSEQDLDLTLNEDTLTIRGERAAASKAAKETFHTLERSSGAFQRTIRLPAAVDPEQVRAEFKDGVLTVTLPKPKAADRSRKIPIGGGPREPGLTGGASISDTLTGSGGSGFIQGDGAVGPSPSTGAGADPENAAKPGGAVHGYNE